MELLIETAKQVPALVVLAWIVHVYQKANLANQKSTVAMADYCHECQDRSSESVTTMATAVGDLTKEVARLRDSVERVGE